MLCGMVIQTLSLLLSVMHIMNVLNIQTHARVKVYIWFFCGIPVSVKSGKQKVVEISVTEGERSSGTVCAQDMLYVMLIVEPFKLRVKKPMKLTLDNKGAVNLAHNWSSGGRTRHVDFKEHFLRELKGLKLIETQ